MTRRRLRFLDDTHAEIMAEAVIEQLETDGGYTVEEMIPGLILAVVKLARTSVQEEAYLDEAANLLADL